MLCVWTRFKDGIAMNLENNLEYIKESLRTILKLEYLGVHIEDAKEKDLKQLYYFSVPESSALQVESAKDLIDVAKTTLTKMVLDSCKSEFDDEEYEEFFKDVESNISDYVLFFAKVRQGEVWNKEMGEAAVNKITEQFKMSSYKLV